MKSREPEIRWVSGFLRSEGRVAVSAAGRCEALFRTIPAIGTCVGKVHL